MKSLKLLLGLFMAVAMFGAVSCSDDFDAPPVNVPTAEYNEAYLISIAKFKEMYWQDGNSYIDTVKATAEYPEMYIKGRVISSDQSGNIYKSLVIQDETAALAMSINQSSLYNTYRVGQEIVISLVDMYVGKYMGLMQLGEPEFYEKSQEWQATFMSYELFQQHSQVQGWPVTAEIDTLTMSISDLSTVPSFVREKQSQLVRFNKVRWETPGVEYAAYQTNTSRNLVDSNGASLVVRNSGYANFRAELLPSGEGDVVGILSYYNGSWQLLLNSTDDVMNFAPVQGEKDSPYSIERAIELNNQNIKGWVKGYIVGAVAPGVETVAGNGDVEWTAPTVLDNTIVIAPTADTKDITKCLIVPMPQGTALQLTANLAGDAPAYHKEILIYGTLSSYMNQAGLISSGSASDFEIEGVEIPGVSEGNGSSESPYTVAQIIAGATGSDVWVKGYIVGLVDGKSISSDAKFAIAGTTTKSNILIADNPTETSVANCIPVQLPIGAVRNAVNLVDNPGNLGKEVTLKGNLLTYFGVPGLKEVSEYTLNGEGTGGTTPEVPTGEFKYKKVTTITSGKKYVICANGKAATPLDATYNYGYIQAVDATDVDGVITMTTEANEFTITATTGGYNITDPYGRYYYQTGTFNSFNVNASTIAGDVWTVVAQSDGTFKITNVSVGKYIQYDTQYGSYGSYEDFRGVLPNLYEKQ